MPINNKSPISRSLNFVKRTGDTMSGSLTFNNNVPIVGKDSLGTTGNILNVETSDYISLGSGLFAVAMFNRFSMFDNMLNFRGPTETSQYMRYRVNDENANTLDGISVHFWQSMEFVRDESSTGQLIKIEETKTEFFHDIEIASSSDGLILESPDTTRYRITIDNSGSLVTSVVV